MSMADVAKQAMFKWRRDLTANRPHHNQLNQTAATHQHQNHHHLHHHIDLIDVNSHDSMKLILEGKLR